MKFQYGSCEQEAKQLIRAFSHSVTHQIPIVTLKPTSPIDEIKFCHGIDPISTGVDKVIQYTLSSPSVCPLVKKTNTNLLKSTFITPVATLVATISTSSSRLKCFCITNLIGA